MPPAKKQDKKQDKKQEKKPEKKSKKVNFVSNKEDENQNIIVKDNVELTETEKETEQLDDIETEQQDEDLEDNEVEEDIDEDHEVDDEIEYDDENVEEIDDLYDEDENVVKSTKKVKNKVKKLTSETEEDVKTNDLDDEDCEYDYNEIYDEKKEEPSVVVNPEDRITLPKLTKYERVRLIGTRAKQISLGAKVMVKNTNGLSSIDIAKLELSFKMIPMKVKRILPDNKIEIWKLSELELDN